MSESKCPFCKATLPTTPSGLTEAFAAVKPRPTDAEVRKMREREQQVKAYADAMRRKLESLVDFILEDFSISIEG